VSHAGQDLITQLVFIDFRFAQSMFDILFSMFLRTLKYDFYLI